MDTRAGFVGKGGGGGWSCAGGEGGRRDWVLVAKGGGMCYVGTTLLVRAQRESRIRWGLLGSSMEMGGIYDLLRISRSCSRDVCRTIRASRMGWR